MLQRISIKHRLSHKITDPIGHFDTILKPCAAPVLGLVSIVSLVVIMSTSSVHPTPHSTPAEPSSADLVGQRLKGQRGEQHSRLQQLLSSLLVTRGAEALNVLEAGCGSMSRLQLPEHAHLTGIDISERQLARNHYLHTKIRGDLETHAWAPSSFDVIVCWDVIEHLPNPAQALTHLLASLAPNGILVLAYPHLWSLKGMVTKFTPYWFHVAFYRYVIGDKRNSSEWDQFPTYFRASVAPRRIEALAQSLRCQVIYEDIYEGPVQMGLRQKGKLYDFCFQALSTLSRWCTLGRVDLSLSDCITVIQRR